MEKLLVLIHTDTEGGLAKSALEAITCAKSLCDGAFEVGLVGGVVQSAADQVADCGASKFYAVAGDAFAQSRYCSDAAAVEAICKTSGAQLILAPASSRWSRVLAGVTFRLGGRIDTHITGIELESDTPKISRWFYRQRMVAKLSRTERPWFMTLDPGVYKPWSGSVGSASLEAVEVELPEENLKTKNVGVEAPPADEQTIRPDAELLFVAGAGWTKKQADGAPHVDQAAELITGFLSRSKASLGSSKSLVDLSSEGQAVLPFMTHLNQVGQTGSTPRHPKGLATCCHGEEPHVVGWRFVNERRAINLDPNCGWAQGKADVLYVADAFQVMRKVNEMLGE